eukprot:7297058-Karenia_brevis.AAC.2
MAALNLIRSSNAPCLSMPAHTGTTSRHCPPLSHADMAALKLITSCDKPALCMSSHSRPGRRHCNP